jgi:Flp pilus assembly protein TadD
MLALGEAQLGAKRHKRALESFQKVLDLRPDDGPTRSAARRFPARARTG